MRLRPEAVGPAPPPPCKRFDCTEYYKVALPAIDADPRSCALPLARKLRLIDSAVNSVVDGYRVPAWIKAPDPEWPQNNFLPRLWDIAIEQCRRVPFPQPLKPEPKAKAR
jgi:hypothetical protein